MCKYKRVWKLINGGTEQMHNAITFQFVYGPNMARKLPCNFKEKIMLMFCLYLRAIFKTAKCI